MFYSNINLLKKLKNYIMLIFVYFCGTSLCQSFITVLPDFGGGLYLLLIFKK